MIKYIKGDLFETDAKVIAHGVNCQNKFGSGVAKTMSEKYPRVKSRYHLYCDEHDDPKYLLGKCQIIPVPDRTVVNMFTQEKYGYDGKQYVDYDAIRKCVVLLRNRFLNSGESVAMPKIGAGLGGGDWDKIEKIINDVVGDKEILVYVKE